MDFPQVQDFDPVVITPKSVANSLGTETQRANMGAWTTSAWLTANRAIFVPFVVFRPFLAQKMIVRNGATVSGNVDVGIYDTNGNRLVSDGGHAQAGVSGIQTFDITDTLLEPGTYYSALVMDNTTGTQWCNLPTVITQVGMLGVLSMASAYPLPDPVTFAAAADLYLPFVGVSGRALV